MRQDTDLTTSRGPENQRTVYLVVALVSFGFVSLILAGILIGHAEVDIWGTFGVPILLSLATGPAVAVYQRRHGSRIAGLLLLGLMFRFAGAYVQYLIVYHVYETGDAVRYVTVGNDIASRFWAGETGVLDLIPTGRSTTFVEQLTGLVQTFTGATTMGSFMVFAWLSFLGSWAMISAARTAVPSIEVKRYAALVLFLPSMLFWASNVGKDAWMVFTLGIFALGAARVFTRGRFGIALVASGAGGMVLVRPHVALLGLAAFGVAMLFRSRTTDAHSRVISLRTIAVVALLVIGFSAALSQASQLLPGFTENGSADLTATLEATALRSSRGGSEIEAASPNSLLQYPQAFLTVMFRPLPFEATSIVTALAAVESSCLLILAFASRRRIATAIRLSFSNPYLLMAGLYTLAFAFAWSSIGNLGIIARQRVQVLPLLLLFYSVDVRRVPLNGAITSAVRTTPSISDAATAATTAG